MEASPSADSVGAKNRMTVISCSNIAEEQQEVDNNKYYEVLELSKSATTDEIKKAYKELAKRYHPDRKGGDATKVYSTSLSSEKFQKPMRHLQILKKGEFMINLVPKDLKAMVAVSINLCRHHEHVLRRRKRRTSKAGNP